MSLITNKLKYRKAGAKAIDLYNSTADLGDGLRLTTKAGGAVAYAQGGYPGDYRSTALRYRKSGVTYAVLDAAIKNNQSGTYNVGFHQYLSGAAWSGTIYTVHFDVARSRSVSLISAITGYQSYGAKSDGWCWGYFQTYLDGVLIGNVYQTRSNSGSFNLTLYNGSQTLSGGEHTLQLAVSLSASGGDSTDVTVSNWNLTISM